MLNPAIWLAVIAFQQPAESLVDDVANNIGCGPSALSVAARLIERPVSRDELASCFGRDLTGVCSLKDIQGNAEGLGLATRVAKCDAANPELAPLPLIVRLAPEIQTSSGVGHFVVFYGRSKSAIQVIDFPRPPKLIPIDVLRKHWDGTGLYIARTSTELNAIPMHHSRFAASIFWTSCILIPVNALLLLRTRLLSRRQPLG